MVRQEKNEEAIFNAAIELESRDERDAYLAKACRDDKKLRADVETLLKAHYEGGSLLDAGFLILDARIRRVWCGSGVLWPEGVAP